MNGLDVHFWCTNPFLYGEYLNRCSDTKPANGVLRMAQADNSNYNIKHDFVRIDGHGNLKSAYACNIRTLTFEPELIVDWLIRHPEEAEEFGINIAIDKDNELVAPGVFAGDLF